MKIASVPLQSDAKTGFLAEARKELRRVPPFTASLKVLRQIVLTRINIFSSSSINYQGYSSVSTRNFSKITSRGAQKFKKPVNRAELSLREFIQFFYPPSYLTLTSKMLVHDKPPRVACICVDEATLFGVSISDDLMVTML